MPVTDEKKRLSELQAVILEVGHDIFSIEHLILKSINGNSNLVLRDILSLRLSLEERFLVNNLFLRNISNDIKEFIPQVHEDLKAISESSVISTSSIKDSLKSSANALENIDFSSLRSMATQAVPEDGGMGVVGSIGSLIPPTLIKKLELVLDATAKFLKGWTNPVTVGVALALPIIGGLAIIFGAIYLVIDRIADSVDRLIDIVGDFLQGLLKNGISGLLFGSGGLKGLVFGNDSDEKVTDAGAAKISERINQVTIALGLGFSSVDKKLGDLITASNGIKNELENLSRVFPSSLIVKPENGTSILEDIRDSIKELARTDETTKSANIENSIGYESNFQNDLMALLNSTISVRVENFPQMSENEEEPAEVFSNAIKPLLDNQAALFSSLDSNLRNLSESIVNLKNGNSDKNVSLTSRSIDSSGASISFASEQYIVEVTRDMLSEIRKFYSNFDEFKNLWIGKNSDKSDKNNDDSRQEKSGN